jgi:hypothetical protein
MFGKKEQEIKEPEINIRISTIPDAFYAGSDPSVKFKKTEHTVDLEKISSPLKPHEKRALDTATAKGGGSLLSSTKFWVFGALILFVLFALGGGIYYWITLREKPAQIIERPIITQSPGSEIPIEQQPSPDDILTPIEEPPTELPKEIGFELPSKILPIGNDLDQDGISDSSEEVFGSDPGNPDTDGDGYPDGHELFYLYNPAGVEPQKLIDSGAVITHKNNIFGFELYYPASWVAGFVDQTGRQTLFSALSGENVEVRVFDLPFGQTFEEWFSNNAPSDERLLDYGQFESRFGTIGQKRFDGLVYFFVRDSRVIALIYHLSGNAVVNYKNVIETIARSFVFVEPTAQAELPLISNDLADSLFNSNMEENITETSTAESNQISEMPVYQEEIAEQFIDFMEEQDALEI